jgi:hypothetical protein
MAAPDPPIHRQRYPLFPARLGLGSPLDPIEVLRQLGSPARVRGLLPLAHGPAWWGRHARDRISTPCIHKLLVQDNAGHTGYYRGICSFFNFTIMPPLTKGYGRSPPSLFLSRPKFCQEHWSESTYTEGHFLAAWSVILRIKLWKLMGKWKGGVGEMGPQNGQPRWVRYISYGGLLYVYVGHQLCPNAALVENRPSI